VWLIQLLSIAGLENRDAHVGKTQLNMNLDKGFLDEQ
jgi:hypothetical protein